MSTPSGASMRQNWAGNVVFSATRRHRPTSTDELRRIVRDAERVSVLGTGHSFTPVADTTGALVSLADLPRLLELDDERGRLRVDGGARYGDVARALTGTGWALPNLASLPHVTVAGACATGTHGSGTANQALSASVLSLDLVTADGDGRRIERGDADFPGAVVHLGRLGVVEALELDLVADFEVEQTVLDGTSEDDVAAALPAVLAAAYSTSVFLDWGRERRCQVWLKERVGRDGAWDGATTWGGAPAPGPLHPVRGMAPEATSPQGGQRVPWWAALPHFRLEHEPSAGAELQSEWLLPAEVAAPAWQELDSLREQLHPVLFVSEVRALAPDDAWLGLTGGVPTVGFHFTWRPDAERVAALAAVVEERLAPLGARPHWGKVHAGSPATIAQRYPRLSDFRALVARLDPGGCFAHETTDVLLGLAGG